MIYPISIIGNTAYVHKELPHINYIKNTEGLYITLIQVTDLKILRQIDKKGYYSWKPINLPHVK